MEKSAKLILKERKYESNTKRFEKMMKEESEYKKDLYQELAEKRSERLRFTKEHDKRLDELGVQRYKRDKKEVEASLERAKIQQLERAKDSYLRLHASMEICEKK